MKSGQGRRRDPVCGMMVEADGNAIEFRQMHFAFCSRQCRERFLANPGLFVGQGGRKAPAQEGRKVIKQRRLKLERPPAPEMAAEVIDAVQAMMGIEDMAIEGDSVTLRYDLLQVTEAQIEVTLAQAGAVPGHECSERLRRAFVHCLEETELDSLAASTSSHGHGH